VVSFHPWGVNEGVNIPTREQIHPWGPGVKLRMAAFRIMYVGRFTPVHVIRPYLLLKHIFEVMDCRTLFMMQLINAFVHIA
jgi:hypothetical protein